MLGSRLPLQGTAAWRLTHWTLSREVISFNADLFNYARILEYFSVAFFFTSDVCVGTESEKRRTLVNATPELASESRSKHYLQLFNET